LAVLVVALAVRPAVAAPARSAQGWLELALTASQTVSFMGTKEVIVWSDGGAAASTVHVARLAPKGLRLDYRPTADRPRRIVIDDGRRHWQYEPQARLALLSPSTRDEAEAFLGAHLPLLRSNYTPRVVRRDQIAGRPAVLLVLTAVRGARPHLRLWVDEEYGLVLRSERYRTDNRLAEVATFRHITFRPPPPTLFRFSPARGVQVRRAAAPTSVTLEDLSLKAGFPPVAPRSLPEGFILYRVRLGESGGRPLAIFQYTDGLATLTLFERQATPRARDVLPAGRRLRLDGGEGTLRQIGSTTILQWSAGGVSFALTGEADAAELLRIAAALGVGRPPGRLDRVAFWIGRLWGRLAGMLGRVDAFWSQSGRTSWGRGEGTDPLPPVDKASDLRNSASSGLRAGYRAETTVRLVA